MSVLVEALLLRFPARSCTRPAATVAVQPAEIGVVRARALSQGSTADVPTAPRTALSGLLRARIEDLAGLALFNMDKPAEAATRLRRAVTAATEGTPLWRSSMWHLGAALEANGKHDQALLYYIKSYNLFFDLSIILDTVKVVLLRIGAR